MFIYCCCSNVVLHSQPHILIIITRSLSPSPCYFASYSSLVFILNVSQRRHNPTVKRQHKHNRSEFVKLAFSILCIIQISKIWHAEATIQNSSSLTSSLRPSHLRHHCRISRSYGLILFANEKVYKYRPGAERTRTGILWQVDSINMVSLNNVDIYTTEFICMQHGYTWRWTELESQFGKKVGHVRRENLESGRSVNKNRETIKTNKWYAQFILFESNSCSLLTVMPFQLRSYQVYTPSLASVLG